MRQKKNKKNAVYVTICIILLCMNILVTQNEVKADTGSWNTSSYNTYCDYQDAGTPNVKYTCYFLDNTIPALNGNLILQDTNTFGYLDDKWMYGLSISNQSTGLYQHGDVRYQIHSHNIGWSDEAGNGELADGRSKASTGDKDEYGWIEAIHAEMDGIIANYCFFDYSVAANAVTWDYLVDACGDKTKSHLENENALRNANNGKTEEWWMKGTQLYKSDGNYVLFSGDSKGAINTDPDASKYSPAIRDLGNDNWAGTVGYSLPMIGFEANITEYPCSLFLNPNGGVWAGTKSKVQIGLVGSSTAIGAGDSVTIRQIPTRAGYDFKEWKVEQEITVSSSATHFQKPQVDITPTLNGNTINVGNASKITLIAQWEPKYDIAYIGVEQTFGTDYFDNNNGADYSILSGTIIMNKTPNDWAHTMIRYYTDDETNTTVTEDTTATGVGWSFKVGLSATDTANYFKDGISIETSKFKDLAINAKAITFGKANSDYKGTLPTLSTTDIAIINMYRVWDYGPLVKAYDLYYTLTEAKNGVITEAELLNRAIATDGEDGTIGAGDHTSNSFRVIDYASTNFTTSDSVAVTYLATDSAGNQTRKKIIVHIVDTTPILIKESKKARFISEKYYNLAYGQGGLEDNSNWRSNPEYVAVICDTFKNIKNGTPKETYAFTHEQILEGQRFVEENGVGNSKSSNALLRFYNQFIAQNKQ